MAQNHKVPAPRLATRISFNKRLAFRARSRLRPGGAGSSFGTRREYTSQAVCRGSFALVASSLRRAFLITSDFVLFLLCTSFRRARPVSASNRIVTVSPMSYIVRQAPGCVKQADQNSSGVAYFARLPSVPDGRGKDADLPFAPARGQSGSDGALPRETGAKLQRQEDFTTETQRLTEGTRRKS